MGSTAQAAGMHISRYGTYRAPVTVGSHMFILMAPLGGGTNEAQKDKSNQEARAEQGTKPGSPTPKVTLGYPSPPVHLNPGQKGADLLG